MGAFPENSGNIKNANQIFLLFIFRGTKSLNMGTKVTFAHLHCHFERSTIPFIISNKRGDISTATPHELQDEPKSLTVDYDY